MGAVPLSILNSKPNTRGSAGGGGTTLQPQTPDPRKRLPNEPKPYPPKLEKPKETKSCRGTSHIRNTPLLGPYGRTIPGGLGGEAVSYEQGTPVNYEPHQAKLEGKPMAAVKAAAVNPTPYTLHPTPYTLHPTPYTLHPAPYTLHPTPYTLHPKA